MQYSTVKIDSLIPASYNPRKIDEESLKYLRESMAKLGDLIPIIVNKENNVIIAGHQRTKAMKANGTKDVNVFFVSNVNQADEIIFNQMHNYQDTDANCEGYIDESGLDYGFQEVDFNRFTINKANRVIEKEINRIISTYGNVLTAVCCKGEVIIGNNYVDCCVLRKCNPNVYILPPEKYEMAKYYLLKRYGRFSYDGLKKESYVQGTAQPQRKITKDGKMVNKSKLYSTLVFPNLENIRGKRVLDFGAGRLVWARKLGEFTDVTAVEFFPTDRKSIDVALGNQLIDYFCKSVERGGLFDYVINEYVINSVDCKEAEDAVMGCLNAFCKLGGTLYFGTRMITKLELAERTGGRLSDSWDARYFDENLFSGVYREGQWYYQHFHTKESYYKLMEENGFKILEFEDLDHNAQSICVKVRELPVDKKIKSIAYEFNLPLPNDKRYNRHEEVIEIMKRKNLL